MSDDRQIAVNLLDGTNGNYNNFNATVAPVFPRHFLDYALCLAEPDS